MTLTELKQWLNDLPDNYYDTYDVVSSEINNDNSREDKNISRLNIDEETNQIILFTKLNGDI